MHNGHSGWVLSNGSYTVLLTSNGTGFSSYRGEALTHWSADRVEDRDGVFVYLREHPGRAWSPTRRPVGRPAGHHTGDWSPGSIALASECDGIASRLEVCVPPELPAEIRRIELSNSTDRERRIEITTYAEVVLLDRDAHIAHPAFSKLFVETACDRGEGILFARRRPRAQGESHPILFHCLIDADRRLGSASQFETDRGRFIGRARDARRPSALEDHEPLSGSEGHVLDPILSLRRTVFLPPRGSAEVTILLGAAQERAGAMDAIAHLRRDGAVEETFRRSRDAEIARLARLDIDHEDAGRLLNLAAAILHGEPLLRAPAEVIARASIGTEALASMGVAPGRYLVVCHAESCGIQIVREVFRAHRYWREMGLPIVLAIITGSDELADHQIGSSDAVLVRLLPQSDVSSARLDALNAAAHMVVTSRFPAPAIRLAGGLPPGSAMPSTPASRERRE